LRSYIALMIYIALRGLAEEAHRLARGVLLTKI